MTVTTAATTITTTAVTTVIKRRTKKLIASAVVCTQLVSLAPVYASAGSANEVTEVNEATSSVVLKQTPEMNLIANMLVLSGSHLSQSEAKVSLEKALNDYQGTASSDSVVRSTDMTQALVDMGITTRAKADLYREELREELSDAQASMQSAPNAQKKEILQAKLGDMLRQAVQTSSGAEFSGCKLSMGIFGNLEAVAVTGIIAGAFETAGFYDTRSVAGGSVSAWEWTLGGSLALLVVSLGIHEMTCNGPY